LGVVPPRNPLNRLTQNLVWVLTSGSLLSTANGASICSGGDPHEGVKCQWSVLSICFLALLGVKLLDRSGQLISQNVSVTVAFLWGSKQRYHNFRGSKSPKTAKNRHLQPKCNGNISKTVFPNNLQFEAQPGTTRC